MATADRSWRATLSWFIVKLAASCFQMLLAEQRLLLWRSFNSIIRFEKICSYDVFKKHCFFFYKMQILPWEINYPILKYCPKLANFYQTHTSTRLGGKMNIKYLKSYIKEKRSSLQLKVTNQSGTLTYFHYSLWCGKLVMTSICQIFKLTFII